MLSQNCSVDLKCLGPRRDSRLGGRRGAVALEFAILAIPFLAWTLFIFELSYDLFTQQALDFALHAAVRQIQTGNAQNLASGGAFITSDFCSATKGLLECRNLWIRVQSTPSYPATTSTGNATSNPVDYSTLTTGSVPVIAGNTIDLSQYTSMGGAAIGGSGVPATPFCNASGSQAILVSAIYLGPSFISGILPGLLAVNYGTSTVHATIATAGFVTEPFASTKPQNPSTVAPSC
jgi:Flp pilus assembly protein TadG